MKRRFSAYTLFAIFAALLVLPPRAQADEPTICIGVCNVLKVFNQMREFQDGSKELKSLVDKMQMEKNARLKVIEDMSAQLKLLEPGMDAYAAVSKNVRDKTVELNAWMEGQNLDLELKHKQLRRRLWDKISAAIAQAAKEKGYQLVIADTGADIPADVSDPKIDVNMLNAMILRRTVLFSTGAIDITADVVIALDKGYAGNGH